MFVRHLRKRLLTIFTACMTVFCAAALVISVEVSMDLMERDIRGRDINAGDGKAALEKTTHVREIPKENTRPVNVSRVTELAFYFNGEKHEGISAYKAEKTGLYLPLEWILENTGVRYRIYNSDDILEAHVNGKKLLVKYGEGVIYYDGKAIRSKGVPVILGNHVLVPAELFTRIEGFYLENPVRNGTVFLNYHPGYIMVDTVEKAGGKQATETSGYPDMEDGGMEFGIKHNQEFGNRHNLELDIKQGLEFGIRYDFAAAVFTGGPYVLASAENDGIYYLTGEKGIKVGKCSKFPEYSKSGNMIMPGKASISENTSMPGSASPDWTRNITRNITISPGGRFIAVSQQEDGFLTLNVIDTSTHAIKKITLNYFADGQAPEPETEWLYDTGILIGTDSKGWLVELRDGVRICGWTRLAT